MRRGVAVGMVLLMVMLAGCSSPKKYTATWYDTFDTIVTLTGYAPNQETFDSAATEAHDELLRLHAIFDRFGPHEGVHGVYAANHGETDLAPELVELLAFCDSLYDIAGGRTDPRMGAVLDIWHQHREEGLSLPDMSVLKAAALDRSQLDMGAVAKGYAVERIAKLLAVRMPSFLVDAGGNIRAGAAPLDGRSYWTVGVQDPDVSGIVAKLAAIDISVVSSGGYQRYYELNGKRYHHIIDPDTLMPGGAFQQVTILTKDSGLADYLSTALFLLPIERGREVIASIEGVDAIWVLENGTLEMTDGAKLRMMDGA